MDLAALLTTGQLLSPEDSLEGGSDAVHFCADANLSAAIVQHYRQDSVTRSHSARGLSGQGSFSGSPVKAPGLSAVHLAAHAGVQSRAHSVSSSAASRQSGSYHSKQSHAQSGSRSQNMSSSLFKAMRLPSLTRLDKSTPQLQSEAATGKMSFNLASRASSRIKQLCSSRSGASSNTSTPLQHEAKDSADLSEGNMQHTLAAFQQVLLSPQASSKRVADSREWANISLADEGGHIPAGRNKITQVMFPDFHLKAVGDADAPQGMQQTSSGEVGSHASMWAAIGTAAGQDLAIRSSVVMGQIASSLSPKVCNGFSCAAKYVRRLTTDKDL